MKTEKKGEVPPYQSLNALEKLLKLIATRKFDSVSPKLLQSYGFAKPDSYLANTTLKFLGLIGEDGMSTDSMQKMRLSGSEKTKEIKSLIEKSYSGIFSRVPEPNTLTDEELRNEFTVVYDVSPRIAGTAVPVFKWFCGQAGLIEKISARTVKKSGEGKIYERKKAVSVNPVSSPNKHGELDLLDKSTKELRIPIIKGVELRIPYTDNEMKDQLMNNILSGKLGKAFDVIKEFMADFDSKVGVKAEGNKD